MRDEIKKLLGGKNMVRLRRVRDRYQILRVYLSDMKKYLRYSLAFHQDTPHQIEARITLLYHGIEKGFLHSPIRPYFAKVKIEEILRLLEDVRIVRLKDSVHVSSAISSLCYYYEWHSEHGHSLDYFTKEMYDKLSEQRTIFAKPTKSVSADAFCKVSPEEFEQFATSRVSIREFDDRQIPQSVLEDVVRLANTAPSACNRQGIFVHLVQDKECIDAILRIQRGLTGFEQSIRQLIVLTADRNFYYTVGERNYFYVDGGIYLMNLLYSLHCHGIAACSAHWGLLPCDDAKALTLLDLNPSEQIIALVAVGYPKSMNVATASHRRSPDENLVIHR